VVPRRAAPLTTGADRAAPPWHALSVDATLNATGADRTGLSEAEAEARLARDGDRALANRYALAGAALAVLLQVLAALVDPLARVLRVTPLDPLEWLVVVGLASIPALSGQLFKLARSKPAERP
jgi:Cation transporting ATPase, C-terminus